MNRREHSEILLDIYRGILFQLPPLAEGEDFPLTYRFDCPEFTELKARWPIERTAGRGSDFRRALRLCRWMAPRLTHKSDYDNHVPMNSLALLDYSFGKPEAGINCLNKAKILVECCLALGIHARRVWMFPFSPYDMDNHVVAEVYDRELRQWTALDPTTGGYFSAGGDPLSCLELRTALARRAPVSVILNQQVPAHLDRLLGKNAELNAYYAKNACWFQFESVSAFGLPEGRALAAVIPAGFDLARHDEGNADYLRAEAAACGMTEEEVEAVIARRSGSASRPVASTRLWDSPPGQL